MRKRKTFKKICTVAALIGCGIAIGKTTSIEWTSIGQKLALISVGMQQPVSSAQLISAQIEQAIASVSPTTTFSTTVGTLHTTTTTTSLPTAIAASGVAVPTKAKNAGTILEQSLAESGGVQGVKLRNISGKTFDLAAELKKGTSVHAKKHTDAPQVLIIHTHTTENYLTYNTGYYNPADVERAFDTSRNIVAAGVALTKALEQSGIKTVHDTTVHDNPQYTGAYSRSEQTVKALLKKYPSIQLVIDVHRDALVPEDNTHIKPTAVIDGKKAAQLMLVMGVVDSKTLPNPNWQTNFSFALQLQKHIAATYPQLMRPMYVTASRYNQHLNKGYILVEVGSDVNTVSEAEYSATLLGNLLAEQLLKG